ncbi:MAG: hypothetical protein P8J92_01000 [Bacteroidia bacterium]|nr:hypothetical protein [Bacteroidia bacterium]|tara:strand:- start:31084 stop:31758 length:675 start_codon:yes stop_codon:yes gene_type:complete
MTRKISFILLIAVLFQSCKMITFRNDDESFIGTIYYDIDLEMNVDTLYQVNRSSYYGDKLEWTFFKNGDIQQKYFGSSLGGLDIVFWDWSEKQIITKYNASDTLFIRDANLKLGDFVKKYSSSPSSNEMKLMFKVPATSLENEFYFEYTFDYSKDIFINTEKYNDFGHDYFNDITLHTNGCIPLNYQLNYYSYQIWYKSIEINEKLPHYKEKIHRKMPRVYVLN